MLSSFPEIAGIIYTVAYRVPLGSFQIQCCHWISSLLHLILQVQEQLDIIDKVGGPTPWVSPIVVAPKPKNPFEIRLCVDMREPNKAILRSRHITPTLDDNWHNI
jgi:hypothetical protein